MDKLEFRVKQNDPKLLDSFKRKKISHIKKRVQLRYKIYARHFFNITKGSDDELIILSSELLSEIRIDDNFK